MSARFRIEKAEEGSPEADAYLAYGWEPFAVVSTPVEETVTERIGGARFNTNRSRVLGHVNVIWFRMEASDAR